MFIEGRGSVITENKYIIGMEIRAVGAAGLLAIRAVISWLAGVVTYGWSWICGLSSFCSGRWY